MTEQKPLISREDIFSNQELAKLELHEKQRLIVCVDIAAILELNFKTDLIKFEENSSKGHQVSFEPVATLFGDKTRKIIAETAGLIREAKGKYEEELYDPILEIMGWDLETRKNRGVLLDETQVSLLRFLKTFNEARAKDLLVPDMLDNIRERLDIAKFISKVVTQGGEQIENGIFLGYEDECPEFKREMKRQAIIMKLNYDDNGEEKISKQVWEEMIASLVETLNKSLPKKQEELIINQGALEIIFTKELPENNVEVEEIPQDILNHRLTLMARGIKFWLDLKNLQGIVSQDDEGNVSVAPLRTRCGDEIADEFVNLANMVMSPQGMKCGGHNEIMELAKRIGNKMKMD